MIAHKGVNSLSRGCGRSNDCSIHLRRPTLLVRQPVACGVGNTRNLSSSSRNSSSSSSTSSMPIYWVCNSSLHSVQHATAASAITTSEFRKHRLLPRVKQAREVGQDGRVAFQIQTHSVCMSAGKHSPAASLQNRKESSCSSSSSSSHAYMCQLGFTDTQAARILSHYTRSKRHLDTSNVLLWLQLLAKHHVKRPVDVVAAYPIILETRAENVAANAAEVSQWYSDSGMASAMMGKVFSHRPLLLAVPYATFQSAIAWLNKELGWSTGMIASAVNRSSEMMGLSVANLESKLAWFLETGFSLEITSKMLFKSPRMFNYTPERNERQLSALQACGLSKQQVMKMVERQPQLIALDIGGANQQAKLQFLTQVMGKPTTELETCPGFLTYSLFNRIGPRWAFHCIYAEGNVFSLTNSLTRTDEDYAAHIKSAAYLAECKARGVTILQLYKEFIVKWQQGEGKQWNVRNIIH